MLGDNDTVNENNMMQYLGIIEQKTNELLQIHAYLQLKELENQPDGMPPGPGTPPTAALTLLGGATAPVAVVPIHIVPPSTEEDKDDESADESAEFDRPLTTNELKAKVMRTVAKRELVATTAATHAQNPNLAGKKLDKQATSDKKKK